MSEVSLYSPPGAGPRDLPNAPEACRSPYRGISPIRNLPLLGTWSRRIPRALQRLLKIKETHRPRVLRWAIHRSIGPP